jgi:putative NADH-flavin reductase
MTGLCADIPAPMEFAETIDAARETMRLGVAYHLVHHRLAMADVVVRAAEAFTSAEDEDASLTALENLFDAVKRMKQELAVAGDGGAVNAEFIQAC